MKSPTPKSAAHESQNGALSISQLAHKHHKARETVRKRLENVPFTTGAKGAHLYDAELAGAAIEAIDYNRGELTMERLRKLKAERELLEIELGKQKRELIPVDEVYKLMENCFVGIKMKILSSSLSEIEQDRILNDLASLKDADFS